MNPSTVDDLDRLCEAILAPIRRKYALRRVLIEIARELGCEPTGSQVVFPVKMVFRDRH